VSSRFLLRRSLTVGAVVAAAVFVGTGSGPATQAGATPAGTIAGQGGDASEPIIDKLMQDDGTNLGTESATYTNTDIDEGIADFVGSAPNTFTADFAVTERPLTTQEAADAKANGRSFAYVSFAALPVSLMTLVPSAAWGAQGLTTITPTDYCQHIQLSLTQLDGIYGAPSYSGWGDSNLSCTTSPLSAADGKAFALWANADPSMETEALMDLLDSTTPSKTAFGNALTAAQTASQATTNDPTPSEHWPLSGTSFPGGDGPLLGKVVGLDSLTGAPSTITAQLQLGAIMPLANDWTGDPKGVEWDLPTAAVQNAQGSYVTPSAASAGAAEADATLASTSDPTTNNLVDYSKPDATDAAAYNNYLMLESYLVVPTNGLPGTEAHALAQFIRFAVGGKGQSDITALGAAPATAKMISADLTVAQQLDAEAAANPSTSTTTTTASTSGTSGSGSTTSTTALASTAAATGSTGAGAGSTGSGGSGSGASLASTGSDIRPLLALGLGLLVCGEAARQVLRRRRRKAEA
jgi:hypothetical protein